MADYSEFINNAANTYGVDPKLLEAIFIQETGHGTSYDWLKYNNPGGIGGPGEGPSRVYASPQDGFNAMAELISRRYGGANANPRAMANRWVGMSPSDNRDWIKQVTSIYRGLSRGVRDAVGYPGRSGQRFLQRQGIMDTPRAGNVEPPESGGYIGLGEPTPTPFGSYQYQSPDWGQGGNKFEVGTPGGSDYNVESGAYTGYIDEHGNPTSDPYQAPKGLFNTGSATGGYPLLADYSGPGWSSTITGFYPRGAASGPGSGVPTQKFFGGLGTVLGTLAAPGLGTLLGGPLGRTITRLIQGGHSPEDAVKIATKGQPVSQAPPAPPPPPTPFGGYSPTGQTPHGREWWSSDFGRGNAPLGDIDHGGTVDRGGGWTGDYNLAGPGGGFGQRGTGFGSGTVGNLATAIGMETLGRGGGQANFGHGFGNVANLQMRHIMKGIYGDNPNPEGLGPLYELTGTHSPTAEQYQQSQAQLGEILRANPQLMRGPMSGPMLRGGSRIPIQSFAQGGVVSGMPGAQPPIAWQHKRNMAPTGPSLDWRHKRNAAINAGFDQPAMPGQGPFTEPPRGGWTPGQPMTGGTPPVWTPQPQPVAGGAPVGWTPGHPVTGGGPFGWQPQQQPQEAGIPLSRGGLVHQRGAPLQGYGTDTVPSALTPGEVVLNKSQQSAVMPRPGMKHKLRPDQLAAIAIHMRHR